MWPAWPFRRNTLGTLGVEGRYPFFGENDIWNSSVNLTKVLGSHNMKAGIFYEYTTRPAARSSQFNGRFNFDRNTANPLDAGHPYANALLGSVNSYNEATSHPDADAQFTNFEWFIQDSWRVRPNLTIDGGIRFYRIGPTRSRDDQLAVFQPDTFSLANAPQLIQPVNTSEGRRGINPLTGEILPAVKIGTFVPNSGNPTNGTQVYDESILNTPAIQVAPRIGFAWDVTADGRTAVRGGFGIFPDRFNDDIVLQMVELPPLVLSPTANYTTISELLSTPLSLSPATARSLNPDYKPQQIKNWSIGVQRDLGFKLVADVSYVGSVGRQDAADEEHQRRAVWRELPAVEHRSDHGRPAAGKLPAALSWLRRHPPQRVRRLLRLPRAADLGEPTIHGRAARRRGLHALGRQERRGVEHAEQSNGEPVPRRAHAQLRQRGAQAQSGDQLFGTTSRVSAATPTTRSCARCSTTGRFRA